MHGFVGAAALPNPGPVQAWLPRPYSQLLRGPTLRWWRPVVSLLVVAGWFVALIVLAGVSLGVYWAVTGGSSAQSVDTATFNAWTITPAGLAWTNLILAALIIGAQLAVWGGFGWRPRWVASVTGGVRWSWLLRCYLAAAVVVVPVTLVLAAVDGGIDYHPAKNAWVVVLVVLTTTPLQAAGEEYLFRGWLTQVVGSVIPRAAAGAVVAALVSSTVFALAHGQQDPWLFADRFGFGLVASWLVWRTGGLEASIAVHTVLNLVAFALAIAANQLGDMLQVSTGTPVAALSDLALMACTAALIDWVARRSSVARLFRPPGARLVTS